MSKDKIMNIGAFRNKLTEYFEKNGESNVYKSVEELSQEIVKLNKDNNLLLFREVYDLIVGKNMELSTFFNTNGSLDFSKLNQITVAAQQRIQTQRHQSSESTSLIQDSSKQYTNEDATLNNRLAQIDFKNISIEDINFIRKHYNKVLTKMSKEETEEFSNTIFGKKNEQTKDMIMLYRKFLKGEKLSDEDITKIEEIYKNKEISSEGIVKEGLTRQKRAEALLTNFNEEYITSYLDLIGSVKAEMQIIDKNVGEFTLEVIEKFLKTKVDIPENKEMFNAVGVNPKDFLYTTIIKAQEELSKEGTKIKVPESVAKEAARVKVNIIDVEEVRDGNNTFNGELEDEMDFLELVDLEGALDTLFEQPEAEFSSQTEPTHVETLKSVSEEKDLQGENLQSTALIQKPKTLLDRMEETGNPVLVAIANNRLVKGISNRLSSFRNRDQKTTENIEGNAKHRDFDPENTKSVSEIRDDVKNGFKSPLQAAKDTIVKIADSVSNLFAGKQDKDKNNIKNQPNQLVEKRTPDNPFAVSNYGGQNGENITVVAFNPNAVIAMKKQGYKPEPDRTQIDDEEAR